MKFLPWFRHPIGEFCWFPPFPRYTLKPTEDQPMSNTLEIMKADSDRYHHERDHYRRQWSEGCAEVDRLKHQMQQAQKAYHDTQWRQLKEAQAEVEQLRAALTEAIQVAIGSSSDLTRDALDRLHALQNLATPPAPK